MPREVEPREESPCLIARLMGLDTLPRKQSVREEKTLSEVNKHQTSNVEKTRNRYTSSRKGSKNEQQFRDVYEVLEAKKCGMDSDLHQGTADCYLTEDKTNLIRKKLMDAKCLSTDENFQDSKEFYDVLEVLESNEVFPTNFLQQPDSLLRRHLNAVQAATSHSKCRRRLCAVSSNASGGHKGMCQQSRRGSSPGIDRSFQKHLNNPLCKINSRDAARTSFATSKGNDNSADTLTRIIVLKPNLGKPQDSQNIVSSPPYTLLDHNNPTKSRDARVNGKKIPVDMGLKHNIREAGESTKKLARRAGNIVDSCSVNVSMPLRCKGYCGDESSSSMSGNESESDSAAVNSKRFSTRNARQKSPLTRSSESSVSREAKKRLSQRWKKTHIPEEIEVVNQVNTLGEMLSLSNMEKQPSNKDAKVCLERSSTERVKSDSARSLRSLGINNRDRRDRCVASPPSIVFESSRSTIHHKSLQSNMSKVPMERNKRVKGIYAQNDGLPLSKLRYANQCQTTSHLKKEHCETSAETPCTENQLRSRSRYINMPPQHIRCSPAPVTNFERIPEVEYEKRTITWEPTSETSTSLLFQGNFSSELHDLPVQELLHGSHGDSQSVMHHPVTETEVSISSKEAAQSSPVSIFDAPFQDDASSAPDWFENLNLDPQGICLQLHSLKSGSEAIDQTLVHTLTDHALEEASVALSEDDRAKTQWKTFYIADVLTNSGFEYADPETFMSNRHSSQNPIDPVVFEKLEKKYDDKSSSRSERRLLFDSINSQIKKLFCQLATWHRRMGMRAASIDAICNRERLQIHMCESLASDQKRVGKDTLMEVSTSESKWLDLADEVELICRELEEFLFHELIVEEICM